MCGLARMNHALSDATGAHGVTGRWHGHREEHLIGMENRGGGVPYGANSPNLPRFSPTPTVSTSNRPPVIEGLSVSPPGMGLQSATIFTFTGQNVSDPDGDALTYVWASSDASAIVSNTQAASHVYTRSGTFDMRSRLPTPRGLSASS